MFNILNRNLLNKYLVLIFAIIAMLCISGIYLFFFHDLPLGTSADFGTFGDFFGGTLNPILALLTIWLLVHSTNLQRAELTTVIKEAESNNKIQELIAKQNVDAMTLPDISKSIEKNLEELAELINRRDISGSNNNYYSIFEVGLLDEASEAMHELINRLSKENNHSTNKLDKLAQGNCAGIYNRLTFLYLSLREYQERGGAISFQKYVLDIAVAINKSLLLCKYEELHSAKQLKQFENLRDAIEHKMQKWNVEPLY